MADTRAFCAGAADAVSRCSEVMMGWTDGAPFPCHDLLAIMSTVEPDVLQEYATKPADDSCLLFVRSLLLRKLRGFVFTDLRACVRRVVTCHVGVETVGHYTIGETVLTDVHGAYVIKGPDTSFILYGADPNKMNKLLEHMKKMGTVQHSNRDKFYVSHAARARAQSNL